MVITKKPDEHSRASEENLIPSDDMIEFEYFSYLVGEKPA